MGYERRGESGRTRTLARQGLRVAGTGTERAMAAVSHGAIAFGFVGIGFLLSLAITAVIWLASKKSPYLQEQSDRAGRYQIYVIVVNVVAIILWLLGLALLGYLVGWEGLWNGSIQRTGGLGPRWIIVALDALLLVIALPIFAVWYVGTILYGIYGAYRALSGHDFRYPPPFWKRGRRARDRALRRTE
jgi:uncharacterized Tic20 family protein